MVDYETVAKALEKATSQLVMHFSCEELGSSSYDPLVRVFMLTENDDGKVEYVQTGQTEMITEN